MLLKISFCPRCGNNGSFRQFFQNLNDGEIHDVLIRFRRQNSRLLVFLSFEISAYFVLSLNISAYFLCHMKYPLLLFSNLNFLDVFGNFRSSHAEVTVDIPPYYNTKPRVHIKRRFFSFSRLISVDTTHHDQQSARSFYRRCFRGKRKPFKPEQCVQPKSLATLATSILESSSSKWDYRFY